MNLEDCSIGALHSLDAFNFLTGLFFLIVFLTVLLALYFFFKHALGGIASKQRTIMYYLVVFLLIVTIIMDFFDIAYSFYIASQVYGQFNEFQQDLVNCSSPVYYSSFVSVVIVFLYIFVEIGLAVLLFLTVICFTSRIFC